MLTVASDFDPPSLQRFDGRGLIPSRSMHSMQMHERSLNRKAMAALSAPQRSQLLDHTEGVSQ
jgi:hypothetical protein